MTKKIFAGLGIFAALAAGYQVANGTAFMEIGTSLTTNILMHGAVMVDASRTSSNCSSTASPAVCAAAAAGKVQVAASSTSLVVNTTAVTANSEIGCLTYSTEGITAPTNMASLLTPYVSSRTAGTSFTLTLPVAPATNAVNVGYCLIN